MAALIGVSGFSKVPVSVMWPMTTNSMLHPCSICSQVIFCFMRSNIHVFLIKQKKQSFIALHPVLATLKKVREGNRSDYLRNNLQSEKDFVSSHRFLQTI